ncbi:hypothetical protein NCC49_003429 [Naganishia albida]|nr:hypothetical protein NCC49_003429 [Naganishia albida]
MHVPLNTPEKEAACREYIQALVECHERGLMTKLLGGCNDQKQALTMCLRQERIERTTRNREKSKLMNEKKQKAWESLEE